MDVALVGDTVYALTRIGVITASPALEKWTRDSRFPMNTRQISNIPGDTTLLAITPTSVFVVDEQAKRLAVVPDGGTAVDLIGVKGGAAILAVRAANSSSGVWRIEPDGTSRPVLADVDPWDLVAEGKRIWVATLNEGVWRSEDSGETFKKVSKSGVASAVAVADGEVLAAWEGGLITDATGNEVRCTVPGGTVTSMTSVDGVLFAVADTANYPFTALFSCDDQGQGVPVPTGGWDDDHMPFQPTAIWPFDKKSAIVGTFRAGPALVNPDGLRITRSGFYATLGTAMHQEGNTLLVGFMSTGVYTTKDEGKTWVNVVKGTKSPLGVPPVSDTTDLYLDGEEIVVVDFDGITIGKGPYWRRVAGVEMQNAGRRNGLVEIAKDGEGRRWGRDFTDRLWLETEAGWEECATKGVRRLDGRGKHLVLATDNGFLRPKDCAVPAELAWDLGSANKYPLQCRSTDGWVLAPGSLWNEGRKVASLPEGDVQALAVRKRPDGKHEALVALLDVPLQSCIDGVCSAISEALPGPLEAIGWFESGRIWALEKRGTVLLSGTPEDTDSVRLSATAISESSGGGRGGEFRGPALTTQLEIPPWRKLGTPDFQNRGLKPGTTPAAGSSGASGVETAGAGAAESTPASETQRPWALIVAAEFAAAAAIAGAVWWTRRRRPRRHRPR